MLRDVNNILNSLTMYRLVLYCLFFISSCAIFLGFIGKLSYEGPVLLGSACLFFGLCYYINFVLAKVFKAAATYESSLISGSILFLIMPPVQTWMQVPIAGLVCLVAMLSKYTITWHRKHLLNPAALAALVFAHINTWEFYPVWWVANSHLAWIVLICGLLVVKKTCRFPIFYSYLAGFLIAYVAENGLFDFSFIPEIFNSWPLVFFATIMLIEPTTLPPREYQRVIYGFLIGILMSVPFPLPNNLYASPEMILIIGNLVTFCVRMKSNVKMRLEKTVHLSSDSLELVFHPDQSFSFEPGQYLEWSLPHKHQDSRGIRRYFTIASSPEEKEVRIGVRVNQPCSTFKDLLQNLKRGDELFASNLSGDFILSGSNHKNYVFIAGGIGITPFISMIRSKKKLDRANCTLFYANKNCEIPYLSLLQKIQKKIRLKTIYVIGDGVPLVGEVTERGTLNEEMIKKYVPDFKKRDFYLSGPNAMVDSYKKLIRKMGVPMWRIKTDYFPGY